jgi:hypothetical protein
VFLQCIGKKAPKPGKKPMQRKRPSKEENETRMIKQIEEIKALNYPPSPR